MASPLVSILNTVNKCPLLGLFGATLLLHMFVHFAGGVAV